ncbi:MAG TPA: GSU2403 family nucleotidyltransferase fold protein [Conexibacter sp.]|jgi:hypothetical protein
MTYTATTVLARRTLLDALQALKAQRDALVLVGAQAVYLYTGEADVPIATQTKDSDLVVIPADLHDAPTLDDAMRAAGFVHDVTEHQPGAWLSPDGIPVELLVPATLHRGGGRRGARIPPHSKRAARTVPGLEAAAADHRIHTIAALDPADDRRIEANVASPAALVVAKVHKIGERHDRDPGRLLDKDAHDLYRLLRAVDTDEIADGLNRLRSDRISAAVTSEALRWLRDLSREPAGLIPTMAGRIEQNVGDPQLVAEATWALVQEALGPL